VAGPAFFPIFRNPTYAEIQRTGFASMLPAEARLGNLTTRNDLALERISSDTGTPLALRWTLSDALTRVMAIIPDVASEVD
jgi:hypothetical protein